MASYHLSIKSGKKGKAAEHAAYIARQGKYGRDDDEQDLTAMAYGNMPDWAIGNPQRFWNMADKHERANGAAYREYEIALPAELTIEQQRELLDEFIRQEVGDKPYQIAIHEPNAALGGVKQPHGHIMTSDRLPDGIDRPPEQIFRRYNAKHPELGGWRKDSGGKDPATLKSNLKARRESWADLQNRILQKYGHAARVDHRSNEERGINTAPEKHLGSGGIKRMSQDEKKNYHAKRQGIRESIGA